MEKITGVVEIITYSNEETDFSIIKLDVKNYRELVTLVGNMAYVGIGSVVEAMGEWVVNPKFGKQFNVQKWEEFLPVTVNGIEKYLSSGMIRGIGPKYANLIVNKFGKDTIDVIENHPEKLSEIKKLGEKRIKQIISSWNEQKDIKNVMIFLQDLGVTANFGCKIYRKYGSSSISKIRSNPYCLAENIEGVGFRTADEIAFKLGIDKNSHDRCRAGIFFVLKELANTCGYCYVPEEILVEKCVEILEIQENDIVNILINLIENQELFKEDEDKIYLPMYYYSEIGLARRINDICNCKFESKKNNLDEIIKKLKKSSSMEYDKIQIDAVKLAVNSKFSVITGGPGTGKTTIIKAIINIFKIKRESVVLAAPTGRAAKRMCETCNSEAKTIHRLILNIQKEERFVGSVLIVDEVSMVDLLLIYGLLKLVPDEVTVILVGDVDQLPSIGAGNVLRDIISSKVIPVIKLSRIYRQALDSQIIINSHNINQGKMPVFSGNSESDFFFIEETDPEKAVKLISNLFSERISKYYNLDPILDVQVLTPMRKGETGASNLNNVLQSVLNKNTDSIKHGATIFKLEDKVMQIKNNYDKEIFNGDIGIIKEINNLDKKLSVKFEDKLVVYDFLDLEELVLSYAMTIHKSQGVEFPVVILPFSFKHYIMLQKNLLYTAVTRAKKAIVLIGEKRAISYAVKNNVANVRYSLLEERLKNKFDM
ncbi:MAG: ATP-dependent RecD-like DNA helicase [Candidatus Paraimprobicoccus trichonymphae]|uniref:ATP-dependent RecD2 DNA helicase n=1 Tax=Candidatus Paraimprobicoccus trichonymphae TaxID=3033793 RepID=A0AA48HZD5_9FIRM|nr:MAG: ATP-dependent RecD-like DNA helicase [Candidatus Paraimprobicoccus trichonymphae]